MQVDSGERQAEVKGSFDAPGGTALEPERTGHEPLNAAQHRFVRAQDMGAGGLDTHRFASATAPRPLGRSMVLREFPVEWRRPRGCS
jgi:hypothetical protein